MSLKFKLMLTRVYLLSSFMAFFFFLHLLLITFFFFSFLSIRAGPVVSLPLSVEAREWVHCVWTLIHILLCGLCVHLRRCCCCYHLSHSHFTPNLNGWWWCCWWCHPHISHRTDAAAVVSIHCFWPRAELSSQRTASREKDGFGLFNSFFLSPDATFCL